MAHDDDAMMPLILLAVFAQVADTLTYLALPNGGEQNPLVIAMDPTQAVFLKAGVVMLAIAAAGEEDHRGFPGLRDLILGVIIFAGALGFGSNLAVLL